MSRVGKKPILIPKGVEIKLTGDLIKVKGPKGELSRRVHPQIRFEMDGDKALISVAEKTRESDSLHGLFRILINNMVTGVTKGFERTLEIVGVGYRAELNGRTAVFNLGYSHPINFELPEGIDARIEKQGFLLTSELYEEEKRLSADGISEFITDGVLVLHYLGVGSTQFRSMQIRKMRYSDHQKEYLSYAIQQSGIELKEEATFEV